MPLSQVNPAEYPQLLTQKAERLRSQFAHFSPPALAVHDSPPLHFRQRAEFRVWHLQDRCFYAMFRRDSPKTPVEITQFPVGSQLLNELMHAVMTAIQHQPILRTKLFQVEFLTTLSGEALVTLIYHRALDAEWNDEALRLQESLQIKLIGRSKKQRIVLSEDFVTESLCVENKHYRYQQVENSFTQPNAAVNQKMLTWALKHSGKTGGDLLELYCGNGNFTAVLAQNFRRVLATEISKTSVASANFNFAGNGVNNVSVVRMSSEEIAAAIDGKREYRRLRDVALKDFQFTTILLDPPRAGLDENTLRLAAGFDHIIYISCNPTTLCENLQTLIQSHSIAEFALFDQFPYTDHIECGVVLRRNNN